MAFQDRARGACARLHLTAIRKKALVGVVLILGAVAASAAFALASPLAAGEVVVVERADAAQARADAAARDQDVSVPDAAEGAVGAGASADAEDAGAAAELCVHVDGAVESPGVYSLPAGSRVVDAVEAAGGMAGDARSSGVNLAQVLVDGQQVVIPGADDEVAPAAAATAVPEGQVAGGPVNVNTAGVAELTTLDGIGEATAEKIIADREANGPFVSIDDLKRVSGIGDKKLEAIRDDVCL